MLFRFAEFFRVDSAKPAKRAWRPLLILASKEFDSSSTSIPESDRVSPGYKSLELVDFTNLFEIVWKGERLVSIAMRFRARGAVERRVT